MRLDQVLQEGMVPRGSAVRVPYRAVCVEVSSKDASVRPQYVVPQYPLSRPVGKVYIRASAVLDEARRVFKPWIGRMRWEI